MDLPPKSVFSEMIVSSFENNVILSSIIAENIYRHTGVDLADGAITQSDIETLLNVCRGDEGLLSCYLKRRIAGEPMAYILGYVELDGMQIPIDKRAYITDPEVIHLVNHLKAVLAASGPKKILEIGTGCGSMSFCLEKTFPDCEFTAIDIDSDAIALAKSTAKSLGSSIFFEVSDYFSRLPSDYRPDVIFTDPPWGDENSIYEPGRSTSHYMAMPGITVWPFKTITGIHEQIIEEISLKGFKCDLFMNFGTLGLNEIENAVRHAPNCTLIHPADTITLAHITF